MRVLTTICLLFMSSFLTAQDCAQPTHQETLEGGNLETTLGIRDLWWNGNDGQYFFPKRETDKVASLFAGAFWISGFGPKDEFLVAAQQFGASTGNSDYWAGPDGTAESCENWDQHFKIRKREIDAFKNLTAPTTNNIPESILKWPATGNPFFEEFNGFSLPLQTNGYADFIDQNEDGIYNPMEGDHPRLNGASEIAWWVMNDFGNVHSESGGSPLIFQIQVTAYVFDQGQTAIDNSSIYKAKIINMASERRRDCTFSLWVDADVGCPEDDAVGCLPDENLAFFYNLDDVDGSSGDNGDRCTGGVNTHGENPPVMGIKFLESESAGSDSLDMIGFLTNGPFVPGEFNIFDYHFGLANGFTTDTITASGATFPFAHVGNPADPKTDSLCDSLFSLVDVIGVLTFGYFDLEPNESQEFTFMITGMEDVPLPCPDITPLIEATNEVEDFFMEQEVLTSTRQEVANNKTLKIFPNPSSGSEQISISLEGQNLKEIRIINQFGTLVRMYDEIYSPTINIGTTSLGTGIYIVECIDENAKRYTKKVVILD